MTTFYISDLHLNHSKIIEFSPNRMGKDSEEHDELLIQEWNKYVSKRDKVWVLGDVAFGLKGLEKVKRLNGHKDLIRGNHDMLSTKTYLEYFNQVYGIVKDRGLWLSHAPIHPNELRNKINVHGHVHNETIPDSRYINVCVESVGRPISYDELIKLKDINYDLR